MEAEFETPTLPEHGAGVLAIVLISVLVISILVWWCIRRRVKGRTVCLLGLSNSGKTLLFLQLKFGSYGDTQNSIVENVQQYEPSNVKNSKPITLVDVPGSERIRDRLFSKYKEVLRGVVLVLDSANFPSEAHDVAELLYDLLSDPNFNQSKSPLLVACNKQDLALAAPKDSIMTALEKEITKLHSSRQAKPTALDGGPRAQSRVEFFKEGKEFNFSDLPSWMGVCFMECSARGKDKKTANIREVQEWIDGLCY